MANEEKIPFAEFAQTDEERRILAEPICRLNDYFFKRCFGREESKTALLALINAIIERPGRERITDLQLRNGEIVPEAFSDKNSRLDILAQTASGAQINIEMQVKRDNFMAKRTLFYLAKIYSSQLTFGMPYAKLCPVIMINLLNFNMFQDTERPLLHREFQILESTNHELLADDFEIHFVEISKYERGLPGLGTELERWLKYFSRKATDAEMKEIAMTDTAIKNVLEQEEAFQRDRDAMLNYTHRLLEESSYISNMQLERQKGIAEGRAEGRGEGISVVAKAMLAEGYPMEEIARLTKLPLAQIKDLNKQ